MKRTRARRFSFTLIELTLTAAVTTLLMAGLASAVVLASRALPDPNRPSSDVLAQGRALDRVAADLQYARYITERGAHAVTFTVADRDGDGSPECLRFSWSGTAGDPLTLEYNHAAAAAVLDNVQQFDLTYDTQSVAETYSGLPIDGAEFLISSDASASGLTDYNLDKKNWIGEYFAPGAGGLPAEAFSWRVTRAQVLLQQVGTGVGTLHVQMRDPDADFTPATTVRQERALDETTLPKSWVWREFTFDAVTGLRPDQGLCLVLLQDATSSACKTRYRTFAGGNLVVTSKGEGFWNFDNGSNLLQYVYGRPQIPGPVQTATRQFITGVHIALRAGTDATAREDTLVRTFNVPEVLSSVWEADFSTLPTTLDMNGDGAGDWVTADASAFVSTSLVSGVWHADRALDTSPGCDFTQLTNIEVVFRDTATTGGGAGIWAYVDRSGNTYGVVYAIVAKQADGSQTLTVSTKPNSSNSTQLLQLTKLTTDFVNLRLLVDPAADTVNANVNGIDKGTFSYPRYTDNSLRLIELYPVSGDTGAEFDSVRIRVGGNW